MVRSKWILQRVVLAIEHGKLGQKLMALAQRVLFLIGVDHVLVFSKGNLTDADFVVIVFEVLLEGAIYTFVECLGALTSVISLYGVRLRGFSNVDKALVVLGEGKLLPERP